LALPLDELNRHLSDNRTKPADNPEGEQLKKMLNKVNEMSEQRRNLLQKLSDELRDDDITAKCLAEKNEDNQVALVFFFLLNNSGIFEDCWITT
uniref:ALIX_LYPXL_bnd domain-containing protein n=1 Tax=Gongylonema pulchrum TaxID=637853 RepID=A0A183EWS1_9BILA